MPGIAVDMQWQRPNEPALSSTTTRLDWCRTYIISPHVIRTGDEYRMYYIGRTGESLHVRGQMDYVIGMATSEDGLEWEPYGDTPVLTVDEVHWGAFSLQTPCVLWDEEEQRFKLWFTGYTEWIVTPSGMREYTERLGYATSDDGIGWDVHPDPVFESGRRPCVHKEGPGRYRMWMNFRPSREAPWDTLYQNV